MLSNFVTINNFSFVTILRNNYKITSTAWRDK